MPRMEPYIINNAIAIPKGRNAAYETVERECLSGEGHPVIVEDALVLQLLLSKRTDCEDMSEIFLCIVLGLGLLINKDNVMHDECSKGDVIIEILLVVVSCCRRRSHSRATSMSGERMDYGQLNISRVLSETKWWKQ